MSERAPAEIVASLRDSAGDLYADVNCLTSEWLAPLEQRLADISNGLDQSLRRKIINDPVWKTLEFDEHEVLLLDSPLLQRLRGVRQLGLAHLVFPGANHNRFEHVCGVVEAASRMFDALKINCQYRERRQPPTQQLLPRFSENDKRLVRLAALLHDVGHGPFSHAIEPVIEHRYKDNLKSFYNTLQGEFALDSRIAAAEAISVLVVISESFSRVISTAPFSRSPYSVPESQLQLMSIILGARSAEYEACLSAIISSQVDADKLDYMARDAHHTGMPIAFDTERLLRKIEVVQCTADNLPSGVAQQKNIEFARTCKNGGYSDIAVVASGVGALEQMLIGRAFLYDRLYHHHKVRAADAMAQRMIHFAEQEQGQTFGLDQLYLNIGDDGLIRVLGGILQHEKLGAGGESAKTLARSLLDRDLYHRAFVFRATFHTGTEVKKAEDAASLLSEIWAPVSTDLSDVSERVALEDAIFERAKLLAENISDKSLAAKGTELRRSHVIVDLSDNRIKPVTINVHVEDGTLEEPNLSFDPSRWSHVYDLQKRTGYVFAPRKMVSLILLASSVVFFEKWGYCGGRRGQRLVKSGAIKKEWLSELRQKKLIDQILFDALSDGTAVRHFLREDEIDFPAEWIREEPDVKQRVSDSLRTFLPQGVSPEDHRAVQIGLRELSRFVGFFNNDDKLSKEILSEAELQTHLLRYARSGGLHAAQGEEFAGGEADVIIDGRCLIENKIDKSGSDPFEVKADAPYQANRYARAMCLRVFFTLVAYTPKSETNLKSLPQSVRVSKLNDMDRAAVEIRFVVPMGLSNPSRAKAPAKGRRTH